MKKAFLLTGIIAWSIMGLIVLGVLIASLSGINMPGWIRNLPGLNAARGGSENMIYVGGSTVLIKEESFPLDGVAALNIRTTHQKITVTLSNDSRLTVRQYDNENARPFTSDAGLVETGFGTLDISTRDRGFSIGILTLNFDPRLEISLPRSYAGNVALISTSGTVHIADSVTWGDTLLQSTSGSIRLNAPAAFGNLWVKSTSGTIRSEKITGMDISIESTSGSHRLGALDASGNVSLRSTSGSVSASGISGAEISAATSSGSQTLGALDSGGLIRLTSASGTVRADAVRSPQHYITTSSGSIRIGELTGQGEVRSTSGSVRTG
jgi:DUF4097 and DUF4098 domain-containing protein YvlB